MQGHSEFSKLGICSWYWYWRAYRWNASFIYYPTSFLNGFDTDYWEITHLHTILSHYCNSPKTEWCKRVWYKGGNVRNSIKLFIHFFSSFSLFSSLLPPTLPFASDSLPSCSTICKEHHTCWEPEGTAAQEASIQWQPRCLLVTWGNAGTWEGLGLDGTRVRDCWSQRYKGMRFVKHGRIAKIWGQARYLSEGSRGWFKLLHKAREA